MENVEIKKLLYSDVDRFIELLHVFEEVFEMTPFETPGRDYLTELVAKDSFLVFVAVVEDKVVGGLTAYSLPQYYTTVPILYVYDLAVKKDFQQKGIGKALMESVTTNAKAMGMAQVFVQADLEDAAVLDFYRATGAAPSQVVHFTYSIAAPGSEASQDS